MIHLTTFALAQKKCMINIANGCKKIYLEAVNSREFDFICEFCKKKVFILNKDFFLMLFFLKEGNVPVHAVNSRDQTAFSMTDSR